jgi:hypothetical protein
MSDLDQAVFEQRAHELAAKAGITLDRDDPAEWSNFLDAARSDVLLQRGIAHIRDRGLPEELCDYLARSWVVHVETFDRCRSERDVTMAASWARRHAQVAAAVLAMPPLSPVPSSDTPDTRPAPRVWRDAQMEATGESWRWFEVHPGLLTYAPDWPTARKWAPTTTAGICRNLDPDTVRESYGELTDVTAEHPLSEVPPSPEGAR